MLTQRDIGRRVVVRHVIGERDGRPLFSDVLGELVHIDEVNLTVRDTTGQDVTVRRAAVGAAKPIPPRPPRRTARAAPPSPPPGAEKPTPPSPPPRPATRDVIALEQVTAAGWPAPDTEQLGGWLLRAADGWTNRANSVLPLGSPGMPLDAALERVRAWYAARDLPARFTVPLPGFDELDQQLVSRGWSTTHTVLVQTGPLATVLAETPPLAEASLAPQPTVPEPSTALDVTLADQPGPDWLSVVRNRKGSLPAVASQVLLGAEQPVFASLREPSGSLLAIGRGVVDQGWLGLSLMEVVPHARRRGLARHLVRTLARWARARGAERGYLQVEADNQAARSLYGSLGFSTHHRYLDRIAPR